MEKGAPVQWWRGQTNLSEMSFEACRSNLRCQSKVWLSRIRFGPSRLNGSFLAL
jgi:hypothetical protein